MFYFYDSRHTHSQSHTCVVSMTDSQRRWYDSATSHRHTLCPPQSSVSRLYIDETNGFTPIQACAEPERGSQSRAPSAHSLSLALLLLPRPLHLRDEGLHRLRALRLPHRLVHGGEVGERGDRVRVVVAYSRAPANDKETPLEARRGRRSPSVRCWILLACSRRGSASPYRPSAW